MADRVSALAANYETGQFGHIGNEGPGVVLAEMRDPRIVQIAAWPETLQEVGSWAAELGGAETAPGPGGSTPWSGGRLARVEPLKWWAIGAGEEDSQSLFEIRSESGAALDLSHSRTVIRAAGRDAAALINRYLAVDLSEGAFPVGAVATGLFDHLSATVLRTGSDSEIAFDLFVVRTFGESFWEELVETAHQFGVEVVRPIAED